MTNPGSGTWSPSGTDSRDNGTPHAGRLAPAGDATGATDGSQGRGSAAGQSEGKKRSGGQKGHPAAVPTG
jgi:hypothetical protein